MTEKAAPKRPDSCHELAVKMLDELRSCICEIYVDEGFNGPIYHYSFEEKAVQVAEKFLRTEEENQDDGRAVQGNQKYIGDNSVPTGRDCGIINISDSEVVPPQICAKQVPADSQAQGTTPATQYFDAVREALKDASSCLARFRGTHNNISVTPSKKICGCDICMEFMRLMDYMIPRAKAALNEITQPSAPSVSEPQKEK
jgi:hypothetical protein